MTKEYSDSPCTGKDARQLYGFDPDELLPNRDFWCVESGRLHVVMPADGDLVPEERALLDTKRADLDAIPTYAGTCISPEGGLDHVFTLVGQAHSVVPLKRDTDVEYKPWITRVLQSLFSFGRSA